MWEDAYERYFLGRRQVFCGMGFEVFVVKKKWKERKRQVYVCVHMLYMEGVVEGRSDLWHARCFVLPSITQSSRCPQIYPADTLLFDIQGLVEAAEAQTLKAKVKNITIFQYITVH